MDKDKRETYGQACQIARSMLFVGGAQYDKHKNESKYCLGYKCLKHLSFSERVRAGVIANDFHDRKDLTPNVCALYVEPELRCRGIAGHLLAHICKDMAAKGIGTLYLITEHTSFYERYGWEYLCMVQGDGGESRNRDGFIVSSRKCSPVFPINERKALVSGAVHRAFLLPVSVRYPTR